MPRNSSGVYTLPAGNPVASGTVIESTWANTTMTDIGTELSNSIDKGGRTSPTANLPMNGYKHTGAAAGAANGQYIVFGQSGAVLTNLLATVPTAADGTGGSAPASQGYVEAAVTRAVIGDIPPVVAGAVALGIFNFMGA